MHTCKFYDKKYKTHYIIYSFITLYIVIKESKFLRRNRETKPNFIKPLLL